MMHIFQRFTPELHSEEQMDIVYCDVSATAKKEEKNEVNLVFSPIIVYKERQTPEECVLIILLAEQNNNISAKHQNFKNRRTEIKASIKSIPY